MKVILPTQYLPPILTFSLIHRSEEVLVEYCENYQKKTHRNRATILSVNGPLLLSVPLKKGKNQNLNISETLISYDTKWQNQHLQSIRSFYGSAPYFEYYFDDIASLLSNDFERLIDLNKALLGYFLRKINIAITPISTSDYYRDYPLHIDMRGKRVDDYKHEDFIPKSYQQVFDDRFDFVSNLSIIDLLMCKGPESILYL